LDGGAPRCEFRTQADELRCERNYQLYQPSAFEFQLQNVGFPPGEVERSGAPGICAAPDHRPPLAAVALPHGYYPDNSGTQSFISSSFGLFMNNLYQGGLRQRTVDGVVHSYYDSASECEAACSSPETEAEVLCSSDVIGSGAGVSPVGGCTSSQVRVFVPDSGSDTLSAYAWSVHCENNSPCDDFDNTTRREMILDAFLRAIVEGGVSSEADITQHIIQGQDDFFTPSHFGPAYSVHLPNGTSVLKAIVDVQHPYGAEPSDGLVFPSRSAGQVGQWCGAHSDCESGVCSDPCRPGVDWQSLVNGRPCLTVSGSHNSTDEPGICLESGGSGEP
jgi:hypothetical protein